MPLAAIAWLPASCVALTVGLCVVAPVDEALVDRGLEAGGAVLSLRRVRLRRRELVEAVLLGELLGREPALLDRGLADRRGALAVAVRGTVARGAEGGVLLETFLDDTRHVRLAGLGRLGLLDRLRFVSRLGRRLDLRRRRRRDERDRCRGRLVVMRW